jgi:hypothetical protein
MYQKTDKMINGKAYEVNPISCLEKYKDYNDGTTLYKDQGGVILFTPSTEYSLYEGEYQQMSPSINRFGEKELPPTYTPKNLLSQSQYIPKQIPNQDQVVSSSIPAVNMVKDKGYPLPEKGRNAYTIKEKNELEEKVKVLQDYLKNRNIQIALCIIIFVIIILIFVM